MFSLKYCDSIPPHVKLVDPRGNVQHLTVVKEGTRVYFTDGWSRMGKYYGLDNGGSIRLEYKGLGHFDIHVKDNYGHEVFYPNKTHYNMLGDKFNPIQIPDEDPQLIVVDEIKFIEVATKILSFDEVIGIKLVRCYFKFLSQTLYF